MMMMMDSVRFHARQRLLIACYHVLIASLGLQVNFHFPPH